MILSNKIKKIPQQSGFLFWAASAGENSICELTRISAFIVEEDNQHITFFLPKKLFAIIEPTLGTDSKMSIVMVSVLNFESYQVKGEYKSHQTCTEENIDFYRLKVLKVIDILGNMGLDGNGILGFLLEQPSVALTIHCSEAYEQTPKPGTGGKLMD